MAAPRRSWSRRSRVAVETPGRSPRRQPRHRAPPRPPPLTPAPRPAAAPAAAPAGAGAKPAGGVVLRTLTDEERNARASALETAKVREAEERRVPEIEP